MALTSRGGNIECFHFSPSSINFRPQLVFESEHCTLSHQYTFEPKGIYCVCHRLKIQYTIDAVKQHPFLYQNNAVLQIERRKSPV